MDKTMTRRFLRWLADERDIVLRDPEGNDVADELEELMDAFIEDTWRTWHHVHVG